MTAPAASANRPLPSRRSGAARLLAMLRIVVLGTVCALAFATVPASETTAAPVIKEMTGSDLTIDIAPDSVKWGEETEVTVSAVNTTGLTLGGGLYVSFDEDVLVLEVKDGKLLRPGDQLFNLKVSDVRPITRPAVESWHQNWRPGTERRVVLTILPIARDRIRVRARLTMLEPGNPPQLHLSPTPLESRSLDETEFPAKIGYVWVARHTGLRRALRRIERRIRDLDEGQQRRFALALAASLDEPKALSDLLADASTPDLKQFSQALQMTAPQISEQLRRDPIVALENLRCLMQSLNCRQALIYFGVPMALFGELSREEAARREVKTMISNEKGGNELMALLEAAGFSYRQDKASGTIVVQLTNTTVTVTARGPFVRDILGQIVTTLGPGADRRYQEANNWSFARLRAHLAEAEPQTSKP